MLGAEHIVHVRILDPIVGTTLPTFGGRRWRRVKELLRIVIKLENSNSLIFDSVDSSSSPLL